MTRVLVVALSARIGGGGSHLVSQMAALAAIDSLELTIHASDTVAQQLRERAPSASVVGHSAHPLLSRLLYEQIWLSRRAGDFDVVYVPGNLGLVLVRHGQVVCQQNAWYFTDAVRRFRRNRCSRRMRARLVAEAAVARLSIRRSDRVIANSQTMRAMLEEDCGPLAHVVVVPSAPQPLEPPPVATEDYLLAVAPDDPHKELDRLARTVARNRDLPRLIVAGRCSSARRAQLTELGQYRVELLGQIAEPSQLAALYAGARCVVAHSWFESFGLTPAEALICGTSVAASDIPAHREVCGDAAHFYPVDDEDALAAAIRGAIRADRPDPQAFGPLLRRTWDDNARELGDQLIAVARANRASRRTRRENHRR